MPARAIVDAHLHLWDPRLIRYPWLDQVPAISAPHLLDDFREHSAGVEIEAMVFVQCEADVSAFEREAEWAVEQAALDPRIQALVAWAPLEKGGAVEADLARLSRHSLLRGVRRIIQFEDDLDFCLRPDFIEGARALEAFGLSFDICIDHRHVPQAIRFAERCPGVTMILDHIGKPAIRDGGFLPWADDIRELARLPHVHCKVSGVATEADHSGWDEADLNRYIDVAMDAFGFERVMFGGDWPVATQAIGYRDWISLLDRRLSGVEQADQERFWRRNARRVYRLGADLDDRAGGPLP